MSFWNRIFRKKEKNGSYLVLEDGTEQEMPAFHRETVNLHNRQEREQYVKSCLEQIADAERELHRLEYEYNQVTSHLTDMEELDRLPDLMRLEIKEVAEKLSILEKKKTGYGHKKNRISDEDFSKMEQVEDDAGEGIQKLREAEDYHKLVKNDMRRLNGERHAYEYRQEELEQELKNGSGIALICFGATLVCLVALFLLQVVMQFDVKLGYVIVVCIAAAVILRLFLKHGEAEREVVRVEKDINRLILLQNTVKIRYVNNKKLLDYLCLKFHVKNASELEALLKRYQEEKEVRQQREQVSKDYVYYQKEILKLLRQARIRDTGIWLHQIEALLDEREMMGRRQELVGRRKALREQMDYNRELAKAAQVEVTYISRNYAKYKEEILGWMAECEKRQSVKREK